MATLDIQIAPQHASAAGVDLDPTRLEFGKTFAPDWFVSEYRNGHWQNSRVEPLHNISLHPAAIVFHYGQSIFEGMKAYRWANGKVALFRPMDNARRFARSAERMAMASVDPEFFVDFALDEKDPVALAGAPAGCQLELGKPQEMTKELAQKLAEIPADGKIPIDSYGAAFANKIVVKCP